jgi:hypothetical protein
MFDDLHFTVRGSSSGTLPGCAVLFYAYAIGGMPLLTVCAALILSAWAIVWRLMRGADGSSGAPGRHSRQRHGGRARRSSASSCRSPLRLVAEDRWRGAAADANGRTCAGFAMGTAVTIAAVATALIWDRDR